jgi:hypothetical protein
MQVCLHPSCSPRQRGNPRSESEPPARLSTAIQATLVALPQGPSLRFGLCCPDPSSLIRPHPPRSQAHRDFTAQRLMRDAFAVRERLGDPRAVPGFRCTFLPDMPPPETPGSSTSSVPGSDVDIGLRQALSGSALPKSLQSVSRRVSISGLPRFTHLLRPASLLAPLARIRPASRPSGTFTTRLPTVRSPFPLLAITATATGLLCWWDSHPLEWQLASLHQNS